MTAVRDEWLKARERKRATIAWSSSLGVYALALLIALVLSLFGAKDLPDYSGPMVVRLGSPDGADASRPTPEPKAVPVDTQPTINPPEPSIQPQAVAKPAPTAKPATAVKTPVSESAAPPVSSQANPQPTQAPITIRGTESGNSYDMTLISGDGVVSRSLYIPIWLYLPVPNEVADSYFEAIPNEMGLAGTAARRKELFTSFYKLSGSTWLLKGYRQPDYESRKSLWVMLEEAGFDVTNADYKNDKSLRPVVVLFKVSAPGSTGKPVLEAVHVESSSGYSTIDADIVYGFKKAEFSNSGTRSISGRFTYRF